LKGKDMKGLGLQLASLNVVMPKQDMVRWSEDDTFSNP